MAENQPDLIEQISPADWEATPENGKRLVANWIGQIERSESWIEALERQCEKLKAEDELLQKQLKRNSRNSSKPPSQDLGKGFKLKLQETEKHKIRIQLGYER